LRKVGFTPHWRQGCPDAVGWSEVDPPLARIEMSNHTSIRARDTCQHKVSVVDKRIIDEDKHGHGFLDVCGEFRRLTRTHPQQLPATGHDAEMLEV
jgi:hypothetical protein